MLQLVPRLQYVRGAAFVRSQSRSTRPSLPTSTDVDAVSATALPGPTTAGCPALSVTSIQLTWMELDVIAEPGAGAAIVGAVVNAVNECAPDVAL